MNAVLIGASDRTLMWRRGNVKQEDYDKFVEDYAVFLSERFDNVIITPDDGIYTDIALRFRDIKNRKPIAYYPDKDTFYGIDHIKENFVHYDARPIGGDWYKLNAELTKKALVIICLGFTPGTMIELSYIKYHQKYGVKHDHNLKHIHLFIDERCIDRRLPGSFEEQIKNMFYYRDLDHLDRLLKMMSGRHK